MSHTEKTSVTLEYDYFLNIPGYGRDHMSKQMVQCTPIVAKDKLPSYIL